MKILRIVMGYKKLIQSGNLVETYEYQYGYFGHGQVKRARKASRSRSKMRNRRPDNLLRLKKEFGRLVRSNLARSQAPLFITFTMFETVPVRQAYRAYNRFIQRLRARYGKSFRYVVVPEFQGDIDFFGREKIDRGAVHFHGLFWELPVTEKGERQSRNLQWLWRRGYVDCVQTDGSLKLVAYMSKYLLKAMQDERLIYQKSYVASRNAFRPVSTTFGSVFQYLGDIVGDTVPEKVMEFETLWMGRCKYTRYVL